jgi:tripartite-type tricarboxylate transporter receptor subunit TctC
MNKILRRQSRGRGFASAFAGLCAGLLLACIPAAQAASYPDKPVRLIVPFPPGGAADLMARLLGQKLGQQLGQAVVLDNRGGAGGTIAAEAVAKAAPDGYTLLFGTMGTQAINPNLYPHLRYDPLKDFAPIGLTHATPRVLVVNPQLPAKNIAELIALAKAKPGEVTFGSAGNGSSGHLAGEYFKSLTGTQMTHVPYKGTSGAMVDLLAGRISMSIDAPAAYLDYIRSGQVRALGVTSLKRMSILPDVPTIAESGVPGFDVSNWLGVLAPAGTPAPVIDTLSRDLTKAMADADMRKQLTEAGIEPLSGTPAQFSAFTKTEIAKWARVVKASGARVD